MNTGNLLVTRDGRIGPYWEHAIGLAMSPSALALVLSHRTIFYPEWQPPLPIWSMQAAIVLAAFGAIFTYRADKRQNTEASAYVSQKVPSKIIAISMVWVLLVLWITFRDFY